jgi:hypothetical protein
MKPQKKDPQKPAKISIEDENIIDRMKIASLERDVSEMAAVLDGNKKNLQGLTEAYVSCRLKPYSKDYGTRSNFHEAINRQASEQGDLMALAESDINHKEQKKRRWEEEVLKLKQAIKKRSGIQSAKKDKVNSADFKPRPRLELDEGGTRLRIDKKWRSYTGNNATTFLKMLIIAQGRWELGSALLCHSDTQVLLGKGSRADRVYKNLPDPIKAIMDKPRRGGAGGYRIKPKYFLLT